MATNPVLGSPRMAPRPQPLLHRSERPPSRDDPRGRRRETWRTGRNAPSLREGPVEPSGYAQGRRASRSSTDSCEQATPPSRSHSMAWRRASTPCAAFMEVEELPQAMDTGPRSSTREASQPTGGTVALADFLSRGPLARRGTVDEVRQALTGAEDARMTAPVRIEDLRLVQSRRPLVKVSPGEGSPSQSASAGVESGGSPGPDGPEAVAAGYRPAALALPMALRPPVSRSGRAIR